jgi:hypothetical protein
VPLSDVLKLQGAASDVVYRSNFIESIVAQYDFGLEGQGLPLRARAGAFHVKGVLPAIDGTPLPLDSVANTISAMISLPKL